MESLAYFLPALITGAIAYLMFNGFIKYSTVEKKLALIAQRKKETLPIKLQAYERLMLFCERINPVKLLVRVKPISESTQNYVHLLIANIEQEFDHNLVQQIYISEDAWAAIMVSKNAVIGKLKSIAEISENAHQMRERILMDYISEIPPTDVAISFIKNEVKKVLK